jgi:hypothetical protein
MGKTEVCISLTVSLLKHKTAKSAKVRQVQVQCMQVFIDQSACSMQSWYTVRAERSYAVKWVATQRHILYCNTILIGRHSYWEKAQRVFKLIVYSCGQQECQVCLIEELGAFVNEMIYCIRYWLATTTTILVYQSVFLDITLDKYVPSTNRRVPRKCASLSGVIVRDSAGKVQYIT